jgi:prepilin-type N-terminal cleavage/methylation domain-containing protein
MKTRFKRSGFTLIELGIVLAILSLMLAGILAVATQNNRIQKRQELKTKMDAIESALMAFRKANGYLPCPASLNDQTDDTTFGRQAANAGSCTGGTPAATFDDSNQTVAGAVPVRNIGLPDRAAFDPWGGFFLYVVDKRATSATTFNPPKLSTPYIDGSSDSSTLGSITVIDDLETPITDVAVVLLLSFGPNQHGAISQGQTIGMRKYVGSTNTHEWENCGCNATAATSFDAVFYRHQPTTTPGNALNSFDDTVRYYLRGDLTSGSTDTLTEVP